MAVEPVFRRLRLAWHTWTAGRLLRALVQARRSLACCECGTGTPRGRREWADAKGVLHRLLRATALSGEDGPVAGALFNTGSQLLARGAVEMLLGGSDATRMVMVASGVADCVWRANSDDPDAVLAVRCIRGFLGGWHRSDAESMMPLMPYRVQYMAETPSRAALQRGLRWIRERPPCGRAKEVAAALNAVPAAHTVRGVDALAVAWARGFAGGYAR